MVKPVICADIGGSFIKFAVSAKPGQIKLLDKIATPNESWQALSQALVTLIEQWQSNYDRDSALAISTTGIVDHVADTVFAGNIRAYHTHQLRRELSQLLKRPVYIANDADCFTLAEAHLGKGSNLPIVLGAIVGTGIGGGLVINGKIIEGRGGVMAEWGHGPITRTEVSIHGRLIHLPRIRCGCGQTGCLDTLAGARGIERLHLQLHQQSLTSQQIMTLDKQSDVQAELTIQVWLAIVSEPLALMMNILSPSIVVVGGGLASEPELIARLDEQVKALILNPINAPLIVPGIFHQDGGLIGASLLGTVDLL
ncbi:ROK family protein [Celerinatantimonas diazotrophica]|uniref:N-acetylglucosamine kinase n=1 Tax=Celerinatantimonas diazotrophica TaxID=412034 RepID=A0A4V2PPS2_9GAMM|nr:ROK family protein [Celerinatantimonas diazotrophica]TCK52021.1 N-acetylglucosamine kinase [Celerinatantimonas diazotrophica]CAG9296276.1 N-acetyl-D-glucosamine kinase [Celerinatantimonas diazotrophica]